MVHIVEKGYSLDEIMDVLPVAKSFFDSYEATQTSQSLEELCERSHHPVENAMDELDQLACASKFKKLSILGHYSLGELLDTLEKDYMPKIENYCRESRHFLEESGEGYLDTFADFVEDLTAHYQLERRGLFPSIRRLNEEYRRGRPVESSYNYALTRTIEKLKMQHTQLLNQYNAFMRNVCLSKASLIDKCPALERISKLMREQFFLEERLLHSLTQQLEEHLMGYFTG